MGGYPVHFSEMGLTTCAETLALIRLTRGEIHCKWSNLSFSYNYPSQIYLLMGQAILTVCTSVSETEAIACRQTRNETACSGPSFYHSSCSLRPGILN